MCVLSLVPIMLRDVGFSDIECRFFFGSRNRAGRASTERRRTINYEQGARGEHWERLPGCLGEGGSRDPLNHSGTSLNSSIRYRAVVGRGVLGVCIGAPMMRIDASLSA